MAQIIKIPNIGKGEAGTNTVTIEEFYQEVHNYNKSEPAVTQRNLQRLRNNYLNFIVISSPFPIGDVIVRSFGFFLR